MGNLLLEQRPLLFQQEVAKKMSLNQAIVVQQIHYLLEQRQEKDKDKYFHQGSWWVYNSYAGWKENFFDFWSTRTVRRIFNSLEESGIFISSDQFNQKKYDKTKWYTIDYQSLYNMLVAKDKAGEQSGQGSDQNDQLDKDRMPRGSGQDDQSNTKEVTKSTKDLFINQARTSEDSLNQPETIRKAMKVYWQIASPNPTQLMKLNDTAEALTKEVVIEGMKRARYKDDPFQYCFGSAPEKKNKGLLNKWITAGVTSMKDVKELDRDYKEKQVRRGSYGARETKKKRTKSKDRGSLAKLEAEYTDY